jgi:hypothetical protein
MEFQTRKEKCGGHFRLMRMFPDKLVTQHNKLNREGKK